VRTFWIGWDQKGNPIREDAVLSQSVFGGNAGKPYDYWEAWRVPPRSREPGPAKDYLVRPVASMPAFGHDWYFNLLPFRNPKSIEFFSYIMAGTAYYVDRTIESLNRQVGFIRPFDLKVRLKSPAGNLHSDIQGYGAALDTYQQRLLPSPLPPWLNMGDYLSSTRHLLIYSFANISDTPVTKLTVSEPGDQSLLGLLQEHFAAAWERQP
jgi:hypothetical protein